MPDPASTAGSFFTHCGHPSSNPHLSFATISAEKELPLSFPSTKAGHQDDRLLRISSVSPFFIGSSSLA
jgi:hypothetical protein